jgi:hypothetical protein
MCEHSESIAELAAALAKAQGEIEGAKKDSNNPHFNKTYADLASVWDACRIPLSKNGLSVTQGVSTDGNKVTVTTLLMHASGQWVRSSLTTMANDAKPQSIGSCITYQRRYGLSAIVGIAPDDDDGNGGNGPPPEPKKQQKKPEAPKQEQPPAKPAETPKCKEYEALATYLAGCGCKTPTDATTVINWAVAGVGQISDLRPMAGECTQILTALKGCGIEQSKILEAANAGVV